MGVAPRGDGYFRALDLVASGVAQVRGFCHIHQVCSLCVSALPSGRTGARTGRSREKDRAPTGEGTDYEELRDRKSTRLNSSHVAISYAVFCLKKKIEVTDM